MIVPARLDPSSRRIKEWLLRLPERVYARIRNEPDERWIPIFSEGWRDAVWWYGFFLKCRIRHGVRALTGRARRRGPVRRLAFVIPWYGRDAAGGAEAEVHGLVHALRRYAPDLVVEVFTTTLREFAADWNTPVYAEGLQVEEGIPVRRFNPLMVDRGLFHFVNGTYLMKGDTAELRDQPRPRSPLPGRWAEAFFLRHLVDSPAMLRYMEEHLDDYDAFLLIPYMFATTALGSMVAGPKAVLLPCLHDERYAFMRIYERAFRFVGTALCHVRSEAALFRQLYPHAPPPVIIGEQVATDVPPGDPERFRKRYGIEGSFVLYAGRQVEGKNLPLLVDFFTRFYATRPEVQLVLIGRGDLDYTQTPGVVTLGFLTAEDKADAYAAATALVLLSVNESFSIVIMEAWLQETPVIVSADCAVTRDHVEDSGGGFAIRDAAGFRDAMTTLLAEPGIGHRMGAAGRAYVLGHYTPEQVVKNLRSVLNNPQVL